MTVAIHCIPVRYSAALYPGTFIRLLVLEYIVGALDIDELVRPAHPAAVASIILFLFPLAKIVH